MLSVFTSPMMADVDGLVPGTAKIRCYHLDAFRLVGTPEVASVACRIPRVELDAPIPPLSDNGGACARLVNERLRPT